MQSQKVNEAELYEKYKKYIQYLVYLYVSKCHLYTLANYTDDLLAEASIAFIIATRDFNLESCELNQYQRHIVKMAIFSALRVYIWKLFNMGGYNNLPIDLDRNCSLDDEDHDLLKISDCDDYSFIEVNEFLLSLQENDAELLKLLIAGYTLRAIGQIQSISHVTALNRLNKIRAKYLNCP